MTYIKTTWVDDETVVDATKMNNIEDGIENTNGRLVNISNEVDEDYRVNLLKSKNLFGTVWENGDLGSNGVPSASSQYMRTADYIVVKTSTQYTLKISASNTQIVVYYYSNGTFLNREYVQNSDTYTFTTPANCNAIKFRLNGTSLTLTNTMINEGSTALPYEPYITPSIYVDNEEIYNQNMMNYSTSEQRIGTWIDGKPLYRITSVLTEITTTNTETSKLLPPTNVDKVVKIEGYFYQSSSSSYREINYFNPATNQCNFCTSTIVSNRIQLNLRSSWQVVPYITAYYTKTTD